MAAVQTRSDESGNAQGDVRRAIALDGRCVACFQLALVAWPVFLLVELDRRLKEGM